MQDNSYHYLVDNTKKNEAYYNDVKQKLQEALKDTDIRDFLDIIDRSIEAAKIAGKDMNIYKVKNYYHILDAIKNKRLIDYDSNYIQSIQYREPTADWDFADIKVLGTSFIVADEQKNELARLISLSDQIEIEATSSYEVAVHFYVTNIWQTKH